MRRVLPLMLVLFALTHCQNGQSAPLTEKQGATQSGTQEGKKEENRGKFYEVAVIPAELAPGESTLVLAFTPGSGFKWNDEYPASFKLKSQGLELGKSEFSIIKQEVQLTGSDARLSIPVKAGGAGEATLEVQGNFSVCNDTSCKIMRSEKLSLPVKVK